METESTSQQDFTIKSWKEDVALLVEGKKLYVAKNILAIVSPVFEAMFSHPFSEKDRQEVELPGKKYDSFLEFLKCVYPNSEKEHSISAINIFELLPLADEYQVKLLKDKCEKYIRERLTRTKNRQLQELLAFLAAAERYNLTEVKDICRNKIELMHPTKVVKADFDPICKDTMFEIMKRIVLKQSSQLELVKMYIHEDVNQEISAVEYANFTNARGTVLNYTVTNVSAKQLVRSPAVDLWGFQFSALFKYSANKFGFFLAVQPPPSTVTWSCRVKARLVLKSEHSKDCSRAIVHTFTAEEDDWGHESFAKISDVLNPVSGYTTDDKVQIAVVILADAPEIE